MHTEKKNKSLERGIVINNIYCQICTRLNTGVLLIRFNSTEQKTWFLYTSSWNICTINFCTIQCYVVIMLFMLSIYCYVLGLMQEYQILGFMQEYQTFWYSCVIFSIKQTKVFTYTHQYLMSPCACFKCKEDSILLPHMQKSGEALAYAR